MLHENPLYESPYGGGGGSGGSSITLMKKKLTIETRARNISNALDLYMEKSGDSMSVTSPTTSDSGAAAETSTNI
eukprot:CAMPEP_0114343388 /NCGR_PEP_ID=MMETSP0101-20121206/10565_1 /TAXON_ID=38822 ORGANISM="Pteridomonas danica, Strain PT" /NCGR_SAMPLE_ID=MMETSP0101 /ASSEMBLY_ACC=CAM_ASM_000211 /LENGTH=74 /DNA_ID=CAMNT_0001478077 /DNA_START=238 /DNA_END=462 /DNA_ORIENTATION=-